MPTTDLNEALSSIHEVFLQGRYKFALSQTEAVLRQRPGHIPFIGLQIACLLRLQQPKLAARVTRRSLRHVTHSGHRAILVSQLVEAQTQLNEFDDAIAIARDEFERQPENPLVVSSYIHILTLAGKKDEAIAIAQQTIADNQTPSPKLGASYAEAALRTEHASDAMEYLFKAVGTEDNPSNEDAAYAHTQLGHLLDRAKRYDEAIKHYKLAGEKSPVIYDNAPHAARVEISTRAFAPDRFNNAVQRPTPASPRPVFVVGMPRSGTTLTEQIIDAHPKGFGAGELHFLNEVVRDAIGERGTIENIAPDTIDPAKLAAAADRYRSETLAMVPDLSNPPELIVDKAPSNFWHLGFIALAFPNAKIIHCRRDPRDNCLSCFFQALHAAHTYAFDLKTTGQFYREYDKMMSHFRELSVDPRSGLDMLEIEYEETVANQEAQTRRILDFIELDFDEACLRFNESGRVARTLSNDQVRQPIYTTSTKRYERYADHLGPLLEGLGDVIDRYEAEHT